MITSAKIYTKTKNKKDRQNPRTNGKSKAIQTKITQSPPPQFWDDSLSIQVFQRCRVHQVDCGDLIRSS